MNVSFSRGVELAKALIAGAISKGIALKHRYFPSAPVEIRLPWGDRWKGADDYVSFCLRFGLPFENHEQAFLRRFLKEGWIIFDIGAHHGFYTLMASQRVSASGKVYAFEPSLRELRRLQEHLTLNGRENVHVERLALSENSGTGNLFVCQGIDTGCNSLHQPNVFEQVKAEEVPLMALDQFVKNAMIPRIDFIKLDVEGSERSVLRGAQETLRKFAPVIMCELVDRRTRVWNYAGRDILEELGALGYIFFSFRKGGYLAVLKPKTEYNENILAVPAAKRSSIEDCLKS